MANWTQRLGIAVIVLSLGAGAASAARGGPMAPPIRGGWHPRVGGGAEYTIQATGQPAKRWELSVVGQEGDGYWIEMYSPEDSAVMKFLLSRGGMQRVVMKMGQEPAIEMTGMPMGPKAPETDFEQTSQNLGKETITTPAGTFTCEHYRSTNNGEAVDVWIDQQVSPYGVIKSVTPATTMLLERVITGASSRITETPQSFQMPNMKQLLGGAGVQMPSGAQKRE